MIGKPISKKECSSAGLGARDPNFVTSFYEKSRLHYLSTWKTKFRDDLIEELAKATTSNMNLKAMEVRDHTESVFFHVDMVTLPTAMIS